MKKPVLAILVGLMAAAALGAAGRQSGAQSSAGDVRLRAIYVWNGGLKTPKDQYNNPVAQAIREKTGVTVEFEGIMMNETEKLNLMFASGDMPDIVNAAFWGGYGGESGVIKKAASEGRLLPIDDMLEKYPNVKRSYDVGVISQKYLEADLLDPMMGGKKYLIPWQTAGNAAHINNWEYGIFVRGDVPGALGIDPLSIKTQAQLLDFMRKARDYGFKDVNGNPIITATTYHNGWAYDQYNIGFTLPKLTSYIRNADGTVTVDALTDTWIDQHLFIWRMVNEGILDKECFKITDTQADMKVGNGTALFYAAQRGVGKTATKATGLYTNHPEMQYTPVGPLNYANGQPLTQIEPMGRSGTPVLFFPSTCKDLDAAFRYIDYVNTPEGRTLTDYGIEGLTFVRNAQGQPRLKPEYLERRRNGDSTWEDEARELGWQGGPHTMFYGDLRIDWFGEAQVGFEDDILTGGADKVDYKPLRPPVQYPGYAVSAFEGEFPEYDKIRTAIVDGEREKTYRERAYFAATEAEARRILTEWQTYLKTVENGVYLRFLDFLAQKAKTRSDIAF
jgi:putative aldouronate transport system substrate-binding protein